MKKLLALVFVVSALSFGCSKKEEAPTTEVAPAAPAATTEVAPAATEAPAADAAAAPAATTEAQPAAAAPAHN